MVRLVQAPRDGSGLRIAIVRSRFNDHVTQRLLDGALGALRDHDVAEDDLLVVEVPGAVELAAAARLVIRKANVHAVVCLGAVIRGETDHYDHVCRMAAESIARLSLESDVPIAFGVLTCATLEQALARSGSGTANRGHHAALVALEMGNLARVDLALRSTTRSGSRPKSGGSAKSSKTARKGA